jgi:orotate phosphoribosyltransferase
VWDVARTAHVESVRRFSEVLLRTGAIKFGMFTLTSGKLSPYYIDLRIIPSFPSALKEVTRTYTAQAKKIGLAKYGTIAGIPTAGLVFASLAAYELGKPIIYVRKETKEWGRGKRIEGILKPGERVLVIDDIITTGKSILETVEAVRAEGGVVEDALVLVDREEGGTVNLSAQGIKLHTFAKVKDIAKALYELEEISKEQCEAILKQTQKEAP